MTALYPLKFNPIYKDKIWGGNKIKTVLGKDYGDLPNCGETWEISGVEGNISIVAEGPLAGRSLVELIDSYKGTLLGDKIYQRYGREFPLLIKFIDANDDLSIQVHPDDALARTRHDSFGKTEMWYVFQADEGASLISGFNQETNKQSFMEKFDKGRLMDILNREQVKAGDVFFIPAGRVHTIGKGLLLAEIQQTSDVTYRIYDFDRVDAAGQQRELHVTEALDAMDYGYYDNYKESYNEEVNKPVELVTCDYFTTNKLDIDQRIDRKYDHLDSFIIYICFEGTFVLDYIDGKMRVKKGDAILLPANLKEVKLIPEERCKMLESYIDQ